MLNIISLGQNVGSFDFFKLYEKSFSTRRPYNQKRRDTFSCWISVSPIARGLTPTGRGCQFNLPNHRDKVVKRPFHEYSQKILSTICNSSININQLPELEASIQYLRVISNQQNS